MEVEDIEILKNVLDIAMWYFDSYCDLKDESILTDDEIEDIDDIDIKENAIDLRNDYEILKKAEDIFNSLENKNEKEENFL